MFEINREKFAKRLNELLSSKKITPETLSGKIGVGLPTVKNWLKGNSLPSLLNLKKITKLTKTHKNKLFFGSVEEVIDDNFDYICEKYEFINSKDDIRIVINQNKITINNIEQLENELNKISVEHSIFSILEEKLLLNIGEIYGPMIAVVSQLSFQLEDKDKLKVIQYIVSILKNYELPEELRKIVKTIEREMPIAMSKFSNRNKK